jgi:glycosidase
MNYTMVKNIFFLALLMLACGSKENVDPQTPLEEDEPKQYGVPFEGVKDPQDVVLYEVNIRAFSANGDFQGVIDRLDNIKALGVNTIWLMPIHPVGQIRSAGGLGSPYSIQNYLEVNTEFGDLAKLRELVQKAHDRNMSVILDWVANHTSWDNVWMKNKSWYTLNSSGEPIVPPGTNWQDVAELNFNNTDMRKAMIHAMKYWILEANVDGYRCDAVDFVPSDFWNEALDELKKIDNRKLFLLAEGGKPENFTAGFQMNYGWDFYSTLKQAYSGTKNISDIFATHAAEYNAIPSGAQKLRYTTNHDQSAYEETPMGLFQGVQGALSASAITIFTSAAPLLYGSQEVGRMENLPFFTRSPIDWTANSDMSAAYGKMLSIYNSTETFRKGTLKSFTDQDIAVFKRTHSSEEFLVMVNVRNSMQEYVLDAELKNTNWTNAVDQSPMTLVDKITLSPFQYLILKK